MTARLASRVARAVFVAAATLIAISPARTRTGPSLRELVEVADIEALGASHDGRKLAFRVQRPSIAANSYRIDWYVADLATGSVKRVADGGAPIYNDGLIESEPPVWSPDSRSFYRRALAGGRIAIWRTAADGSTNRVVVSPAADVESLSVDPDGRALAYLTGPTRSQLRQAEHREYDDGILIDASVDPAQNLVHGGFVHGRLANQRLVGRWFQRDGLLWRVPRIRHRLDLRTLRELPTETVPPPVIASLVLSIKPPLLEARSPSAIARLTGSGGDARLTIEPAGRPELSCGDAACRERIVSLAWRPGTPELLFTTQDLHFRQSLHVLDVAGHVRLVATGEGQLSGGRSGSLPCALTRSSAICVEAGAVTPPRLVSVDLDSGRKHVLFDPNARLRAAPAPAVEQLDWKLADGREATGTLLSKPGVTARAPLFVNYYYCSGYLRGGLGDAFPFASLVDAGFVVACLNTVPFKEWGEGADRERAALASVESLVGLLDHRGLVDRKRVGMGGFSAGSEATMWIAMNSDLLGAAAVASPQYEPSHYWMSSVRGRDFPQVMKDFQQIGSPDDDRDRWKLISPALNVERIKVPLLMQLPEQEVRGAMELYSKLSNTLTPVEMYAFPDEAHIKLQPRHQLAVYRRNLDWFRYWLQNYAEADPDRAGQYARWDSLRRRWAGSGVPTYK